MNQFKINSSFLLIVSNRSKVSKSSHSDTNPAIQPDIGWNKGHTIVSVALCHETMMLVDAFLLRVNDRNTRLEI